MDAAHQNKYTNSIFSTDSEENLEQFILEHRLPLVSETTNKALWYLNEGYNRQFAALCVNDLSPFLQVLNETKSQFSFAECSHPTLTKLVEKNKVDGKNTILFYRVKGKW